MRSPGKTFGVVGFGNTGRATASIAAALGMKVAVATSKDAASLPEGYRKTDVDELFATCDVVSLHCVASLSAQECVEIFGGFLGKSLPRFCRRPRYVWCDYAVRSREKRVVGPGRFLAEDIQSCTCDTAFGERCRQCVLVDKRAARGVDKQRPRAHGGQTAGVYRRLFV